MSPQDQETSNLPVPQPSPASPAPLPGPTPEHYAAFQQQIEQYARNGWTLAKSTPSSAHLEAPGWTLDLEMDASGYIAATRQPIVPQAQPAQPIVVQMSGAPSPVVVMQRSGPGCLVQALWFIFVGWWLGALAITIAWVLNIPILGLPLGMGILNNVPKILALQEPQRRTRATVSEDGETIISEVELPQRNFLLRAAYFILIGWWWSAVWLTLAYLLCGTLILMPIGLEMFRWTPAMTTLRRY